MAASPFRDKEDYRTLKGALASRVVNLTRHLGLGEPNAKFSNKLEWRFGSHGSLSVVITGAKIGTYFDHEIGEGGSLLDLIMHERRCDLREAADIARDFIGRAPVPITQRREVQRPPERRTPGADDPEERRRKARFVWSKRRPIEGSPAETYLRARARGYTGPLASTLAYLPAQGVHEHALIAAFGLPDEPEPGLLQIADDAVHGVHIIKLNADGSDRIRDKAGKITLGACLGSPIMCASFAECSNALIIAEGVEKALAAHAVLAVGAWAAGGAARLPALTDVVPAYVDAITILADDDEAGRRHAMTLAQKLQARGFEVRLVATEGSAR